MGRFEMGEARDVTRYGDIAAQLDAIAQAVGVMPALEVAVKALNERLEAMEKQPAVAADLATRLAAAEQRAQAAADEAATLREQVVRAEAATRQEPPRRGWLARLRVRRG